MANSERTEGFDPKRSIRRARKSRGNSRRFAIVVPSGTISWSSSLERVRLIRKGLSPEVVELLGQKSDLPTKKILEFLGLAQTTYNKKRRENDLLGGRASEMALALSELIDFGLEVFNHEVEKFHNWLKKPNPSLGQLSPESLFDSITGVLEVKNALNRLEYGNLA